MINVLQILFNLTVEARKDACSFKTGDGQEQNKEESILEFEIHISLELEAGVIGNNES